MRLDQRQNCSPSIRIGESTLFIENDMDEALPVTMWRRCRQFCHDRRLQVQTDSAADDPMSTASTRG
jgi:hypothetical protein